ncbi:MAG TPA: uracil-DNA glycosylase [Bacteroidales bacterium]|nr:uracil-DNA glycosylase [Bacteroidales bacterium]
MMSENSVNPVLDESWKKLLKEEFANPYFQQLKSFLLEEKRKYTIYPPGKYIFAAFNYTPVDKVRVVIIGQDPYHGPGQAHGLCFSVPKGVAIPPSLINIYKELENDLGIPIPSHGNLEKWASQGVLLLNATLTVRANLAASHQNKGWERFTDAAISGLSNLKSGLVFLLWGNYAIGKQPLIDTTRNYVLKAPHPSPLSASRGFFGCGHFSKTNKILRERGLEPINWSIEN